MLPALSNLKLLKPSRKTETGQLVPTPQANQLPEFPKFKPLELSDRTAIEAITKTYPPYSDFNFTSMWSWDIKGEMRISQLNGNLVVRFSDYTTGEPFYSFLGNTKPSDTANQLLDLCKRQGLEPILKLVPESSVSELDKSAFIVEEDRDNFDYTYLIDKLRTYDGNKLRAKRNFCNRFKKNYTYSIEKLDPSNLQIQKRIMDLFDVWRVNKGIAETETLNERKSFHRIFEASGNENIIFVGMFINGDLVGLVVNELLPNDYAILHFEKGDEKYIGIYSGLMLENAKILYALNRKFLNYEQDLGLQGLRLGKRSFQPTNFLKKYTLKAL